MDHCIRFQSEMPLHTLSNSRKREKLIRLFFLEGRFYESLCIYYSCCLFKDYEDLSEELHA